MSRLSLRWHSNWTDQEIQLVRWGETGVPVLLFPTAGADAEDIERRGMVEALAPQLTAGRLKLYSVDCEPGEIWRREPERPEASAAPDGFAAFILNELLPAIRKDCHDEDGRLALTVAGASGGAYCALAALFLCPAFFAQALCLSGTYDLAKLTGEHACDTWSFTSPIEYLQSLPKGHEDVGSLRECHVVLAHGRGEFESPEESHAVARVLEARGVPHRVEEWGAEWGHDWSTWTEMLPALLDKLLVSES